MNGDAVIKLNGNSGSRRGGGSGSKANQMIDEN